MMSVIVRQVDAHAYAYVGYTIVWSGIHECNECVPRETTE